jgi:Domain of unknown function (DUF4190)
VSDEGTNKPQDRPRQEWSSAPTPEPPEAPPGYGQPPAYQQPSYGPPAYGPPPGQIQFRPAGPTVEHPQATLAFVLGLLSVIGLTILGPFGWYYGNKVVNEIDRDPRAYNNRGLAMAGKVLGIIGTVMLAFIVVLVVGAIVFAIFASGSSSTRY